MDAQIAKRYVVRGRVQGVGYRAFVEHAAVTLGLSGWVRNLDDGAVEVYAAGTRDQLSEFESRLWAGPRMADVRGVKAKEEVVDAGVRSFRIR